MWLQNMPDWVLQLLAIGAGIGFAGAYATIRADLAQLHEKAEQASKSADKAHDRIDSIIDRRD